MFENILMAEFTLSFEFLAKEKLELDWLEKILSDEFCLLK
jgi:hypothetical protein